ncbi:MAG TPA: LysM peptidoglycan-binding domain-containing protein [Streptosporangiaceae bacterium]|jgi:LysM repeat protein|nr:LysM peptidoglycan-binding domain-containing protein [Streptosporangiaceae bacterium]
MEKVAEKAGKAAPAVAIAGALVASPQAQHALAATAKPTAAAPADAQAHAAARGASGAPATLDSITTRSVVISGTRKAQHAVTGNTYYKVRAGDTLSKIAERFYHRADDWQWLYRENDKTVPDPNMIYPGQILFVPADPPAHYALGNYVPRHAKPAAAVSRPSGGGTATARTVSRDTSGSGSTTLSGTLGCSGLERLWEEAGGNPADAFIAAEIAMAESGGNQYAHSPTNDFGYWQINASNGALATYDAYGNARAAVIISHDGTDWTPWTTYTSGAYAGRC